MKEHLDCTCPEERFCEECPAVGTSNNCLPWCSFLKEHSIVKITTKTLEFLRALLPKGTKIMLDHMANDPYPVPDGTIGVVDHIDDFGQIHCRWANGSSLAVIPGVDRFHVLSDVEQQCQCTGSQSV